MMSVSIQQSQCFKGDVYLAVYPDQGVCRAFEWHFVIANNTQESSASNRALMIWI